MNKMVGRWLRNIYKNNFLLQLKIILYIYLYIIQIRRKKHTVIAPSNQRVGSGPTDKINRRMAVTTKVVRTAAVHRRRLVLVVSNVRLRLCRLRRFHRRAVFLCCCCCCSRSPPPSPSSSFPLSSLSSSSSSSSTSSAFSSSRAHIKNAAAQTDAKSPSHTAAETWPPSAVAQTIVIV